ncbi:MAG TPA: tectonin domain-containing protein [Phototrophicaceae bacterium]|nr:tectonin domain-containing protein [Phototrophicaceae bacterium]
MATEILLQTPDVERTREEAAAVGARVTHVLSERLVVISLPDDVAPSSLTGTSPPDVDGLDGVERRVAEAWLSRFSGRSATEHRLRLAAQRPAERWDAPGREPPDSIDDDDAEAPTAGVLSTGTPTSLRLTGSVAVGIVMVSGPDEAWMPVRGALKQVSVGSASQVWGVNAADKIYRWNGSSWTQVSGALKHVSVAADGTVWGVNAADRIYRRDGDRWTLVPGALDQVSTGSGALVWGVNSSDAIYRLR